MPNNSKFCKMTVHFGDAGSHIFYILAPNDFTDQDIIDDMEFFDWGDIGYNIVGCDWADRITAQIVEPLNINSEIDKDEIIPFCIGRLSSLNSFMFSINEILEVRNEND